MSEMTGYNSLVAENAALNTDSKMLEQVIRELGARIEDLECAIFDTNRFSPIQPNHFAAWADTVSLWHGYAGSELECLLRRLATLAKPREA